MADLVAAEVDHLSEHQQAVQAEQALHIVEAQAAAVLG
jgi:hypothetical protein